MQLTERFQAALNFACSVHRADERKGAHIPYLAHLLSVCGLVLTDGGSEDEAIAALLHDTLEDHADTVTREEIGARFGAHVLAIVAGCTDTPPDYRGGPRPPWHERKQAYLAHIRESAPADLRVALADKVDNARAILTDYRQIGDAVWTRFSAGKDAQLWYYSTLVTAFRTAGVVGPLFDELERTVTEIARLAAEMGDLAYGFE